MQLGSTEIGALFVGGQPVLAAYLGGVQVFGGAAPWTPADLFGPGDDGVWIDLSDQSTLFKDIAGTEPVEALGDPVRRIVNKSGKPYDYTLDQTTPPTWEEDETGSYLLFGSASRMRCNMPIPFTPNWTVITRLRRSGVTSSYPVAQLDGRAATSDYIDIFAQSSSRVQLRVRAGSASIAEVTSTSANGSFSDSAPIMLRHVVRQIPGDHSQRLDGVGSGSGPDVTSLFPSTLSAGVEVRDLLSNSSNNDGMRMYGRFVINRALTDEECALVEANLVSTSVTESLWIGAPS
jgi:hypothetical protein